MNKFKENSKLKLSLMLFVAIGVIAVIMGFTDSHHTRIWTSLLFNNLFFTGIALFGVFLQMNLISIIILIKLNFI